ncbi:MAG: 3-hydroxyacyl-CoA dehydrogenase NAD-binding domain-containing protein [Rubripirellula sp.]|nr:3-hydroxyacyl-CoA dehydrogenase NAD-binding domain-containing protein [Rubripirellula sp.]
MNMKPYKNFCMCVDTRGVATITLDVPDRPLNILDKSAMAELDDIIRELENTPSLRLAVFQSGKESGFLAGADVNAIAEIGSATEAIRVIETGQNLFQRIEWLAMPTLAVIHGPCLGGGLELALACDYRVTRNNSSTKLGLPEIKLGLIPGWGGTQRLPRLVGVRHALSMILTGKHVTASQAKRMQLVDLAIEPEHWESELAHFIDDVLNRDRTSASMHRGWKRMLEDSSIGRRCIFHMAAKKVASKQENYPALGSALRAIRWSYKNGPEGFAAERNEFIELLATPSCRRLLDLFFARERARNVQTWTTVDSRRELATPIRRVGVVGAGAMGAGIGQLAALRGYEVAIREINAAAVTTGKSRVNTLIDNLADRKKWNEDRTDKLRSKIRIGCDQHLLDDCDLVIEAVVESEDIKNKVFADLDARVKTSAMLVSNTSSLSITKMGKATCRSKRVAGLHFFNPVHRMELVEVVRGEDTDENTIQRLVGFVKALGKTPLVTSDTPGFLVNRVLFPYLGEAVRMVHEGFDPQKIDREIRHFGMPMGPLELLDQVGLDVAHHVANSLQEILPEVEQVLDFLGPMVNQGQLGKKSNAGFYHYHKGKRGKPSTFPNSNASHGSKDKHNMLDDGLSPIQRRLVYPMLAEAVRCHSECVVNGAWAIDLGMVLGTGFAPHRGGPLHVIDSLGVLKVLTNMRQLCDQLGSRFSPPQKLVGMSAVGGKFFGPGDTPEHQLVASN